MNTTGGCFGTSVEALAQMDFGSKDGYIYVFPEAALFGAWRWLTYIPGGFCL